MSTGDGMGARTPEAEAADRLAEVPACPVCGSADAKVVSAFGSHASLTSYWCEACGSPFEGLRWKGPEHPVR
jgi:transposase-like protein